MTRSKLVALAVVGLSGVARADELSVIGIRNTEAHTITVEYRIGNKLDCDKNKDLSGKQTIGPKKKWTVKIKDEKVCCLRLLGSPRWIRNNLRGGKDYEFTIR